MICIDTLTYETIDSVYRLNDRSYGAATAVMNVHNTAVFDECDEGNAFAPWAEDSER